MTSSSAERPNKRQAANKLEPADRSFLPAALEILESPPSPVLLSLSLSICCLIGIALVWSYLGSIDIIASAQGKIQPIGNVKIIQSLESARVTGFNVQNGSRVRAGDILIQLDDIETRADVEALSVVLRAFRHEKSRRVAAIAAVASHNFSPNSIRSSSVESNPLSERELNILESELTHLASVIASFNAQRDQKFAELARVSDMITSHQSHIAIASNRVKLREQLARQELGSKLQLLDAQSDLQQQTTSLAQMLGQIEEARAAIVFLEKEIRKTLDIYISENFQKIADAEKQIDDLSQRLVKSQTKLNNLSIRSPIEGIVQALSITTPGQVVISGTELMRIIPAIDTLEVECYLLNKDIGFLMVGQDAVIKVEAFPFTRYGSIMAKVSRIAADAIPEPDAQAIEGNPTFQKRSAMFASAERTQNLVFPITLSLQATKVNADGANVPLSPGMSVTVEIRTGRRRILEFLFSPLMEVVSTSLRER